MSSSAKCIAFLGTGSDVGKSIAVTAVCRILKKRGFNVAPYKAQNMSNNSYVTLHGGEMGRAQIVQAEAAGVEPHTDMNPVLLKPNSDCGSQIVLQGKIYGNTQAADYFKDTSLLFEKSKESLTRLREKHDLIVMEGAGSCAEVNLRSRDFVNFESAHAAEAPVILVADIDKGGVFAQLIGTLEVIPEKDRARVAGLLINKFRGDPALFDDGIQYLEAKTGLPVLGLIPCFTDVEIDSEDGMPLETVIDPPDRPQKDKINLAIIRLPHISNFTDFAPLQRDPAVRMHYLRKPRALDGYDAVCLPGTKSTCSDLQWLNDKGWATYLQDYARNGGRVLGVCGGYQMLGNEVSDPQGVEGKSGSVAGLGLLDIRTTLKSDKVLSRTQGTLIENGITIDGYEIHMGTTELGPDAVPFVQLECRNGERIDEPEGASNPSGTVRGTYLHGLFDFPAFRNHFLQAIDPQYTADDPEETARFKQAQYDLLAAHFEKHMQVDKLLEILHGGTGSTPKPAGRKHLVHLPPVDRFDTSTMVFATCSGTDIKTHQHGGVPLAAFERLGVSPRPVIDFSVNISPLGVPDCLLRAWGDLPALLTAYPEIMGHDVHSFYEHRFNLPAESVLAGNGSTELIYLVPRVLAWKKVLVPQPAFFEYGRACELAGCEVIRGGSDDRSLCAEKGIENPFSDDIDALFLGSPGNPTGVTVPAKNLLELADANPDKWIVVDQAFIDFCEEQDSITLLAPERLRRNLIVLHSLTKFYALPGLRIGAAISHPDTIARLAAFKEPWTVNALAQKACELLANDFSYDKQLRDLITTERKRMRTALAAMPQFEIQPGGQANFLLLRWLSTYNLDVLLKQLLERGLFVRDCRNFPNLPENSFRIAIRTAEDNNKLLEALRHV